MLPACVSGLSENDVARVQAPNPLHQQAEQFIALVRAADPVTINAHLADGLEFKPYPETGGYSFYWKGRNVIGPLPLENYKEPQTLNLSIEENGARIRVFGRHYYRRFLVTEAGVSFSEGELAEVLADLRSDSGREGFATRWLANHPSAAAVPGLIALLDKPGHSYWARDALRKTTYQDLREREEWERWYEASASNSRSEWKEAAIGACLEALASDDLTVRIRGVAHAKLLGGMEERIWEALSFLDAAYSTSVVSADGGYALAITNESDEPAILGIGQDRRASLSYSMWVPPGPPWRERHGGGMSVSRSTHLPESSLEVLQPGQRRLVEIRLPDGLKPGKYKVRAYVKDTMNGRRYKASFELTVP